MLSVEDEGSLLTSDLPSVSMNTFKCACLFTEQLRWVD